MPKTRLEKQKILKELEEKIKKAKAICLVDFSGLKASFLKDLRRKMKEQGCEFKVAKKTLIASAFQTLGIKVKKENLIGEIALGLGYQDEILPFKILYQFATETENLKILGGIMNQEIFSKEKALKIAKLPSKEELLAQLIGSLQSPWIRFLGIFQNSLQKFLLILSQLKKV